MRKRMELIKADVVDANGDLFPREVLERAVAAAKLPLPVSRRFSHMLEDAQGQITGLSMEGSVVMADVELWNTPVASMIGPDFELAFGGRCDIVEPGADGVRRLTNVEIVMGSLVPPGSKTK